MGSVKKTAPGPSRGLPRTAVCEFQGALQGTVPVYVYDTQEPFGLVHGMLDDELFYAMGNEPEGVHRLTGLISGNRRTQG